MAQSARGPVGIDSPNLFDRGTLRRGKSKAPGILGAVEGKAGQAWRNNLTYAPNQTIVNKAKDIEKALGTLPQFVSMFSHAIQTSKMEVEIWRSLWKASGTKNNPRYIATEKSGIIDLRHFFGSAGFSLCGAAAIDKSELMRVTNTVPVALIGLIQEYGQAWSKKPGVIKSSFSPEDLPSNRLGIEYADKIKFQLEKKLTVFVDEIERQCPISPKDVELSALIDKLIVQNEARDEEESWVYFDSVKTIVEKIFNTLFPPAM